MPISLDPESTADVWLDSDAAKPAESRPTFVTRFYSYAQRQKLAAELDAVWKLDASEEQGRRLYSLLPTMIVSARNLPEPWIDTLAMFEMYELAWGCLKATSLSEVDAKKSKSAPASDGAASANDAPPPAAA